MIRVIVYEPRKPGLVISVPNTAGTFQALVAGFFDVFFDPTTGAHVYFCDEGFSLGLDRNRRFGTNDVVGTAVLVKLDASGIPTELADDEVTRIRARYG